MTSQLCYLSKIHGTIFKKKKQKTTSYILVNKRIFSNPIGYTDAKEVSDMLLALQ